MSSRSDRGRTEVPLAARWARAFGRFWWDFLVGDTPELFVGALAVLGIVELVAHAGGPHAVAVIVLPLLVAALLAVTLLRAWRQRRPR
ncbi:MAG TPA: hypothetical protein VKY26_08000 [Actinomycetota bacterium]|nr:hypothetical protein [Actinomycetota bacterium]